MDRHRDHGGIGIRDVCNGLGSVRAGHGGASPGARSFFATREIGLRRIMAASRVAASVLVLAVALLTVLRRALLVARARPAAALRYE